MPKAYAAKEPVATGWPIGYPYGLIDLGFPDWPQGWAFPGPPWPPGWDAALYGLYQSYLTYPTLSKFVKQSMQPYSYGVCAAPNGDVYATSGQNIYVSGVYKQTAGIGSFVNQNYGSGSEYCYGICSTLSGDIYACNYYMDVFHTHIIKQSGGIGSFSVFQTFNNEAIRFICSTPNGDVYICGGAGYYISVGSIYKSSSGSSFVSQGAGAKNWYGICSTPNKTFPIANADVYACVWNGDIYKQTAGSGSFVAQGAGNKNWTGITSDQNQNIYACVYGGDIYKQTNCEGAFVAEGAGNKDWNCIHADKYNNIFAGIYYSGGGGGTGLYRKTHGVGSWVNITTLATAGLAITSICSTPSGNIYSSDAYYIGGVYKASVV
jgi:hypothetical protein